MHAGLCQSGSCRCLPDIVQVQGCIVLLAGIVGWCWTGIRKRTETRRLQAAGYADALSALTGAIAAGQTPTDAAARAVTAAAAAAAGAASTQPIAALPSTVLGTLAMLRQLQLLFRCFRKLGVKQRKQLVAPDEMLQHSRHKYSNNACTGLSLTTSQVDVGLRNRAAAGSSADHTSKQQQGNGHMEEECTTQTAGAEQMAASVERLFKSCPAPKVFQQPHPVWPPLAAVCPVKGCRHHSKDNWTTQLAAAYGGSRLFVFVVESASDPAVAAVRQMMEHHLQQQQQRQQSADQQQIQWQTMLYQQWLQQRLHQLPACVLDVWQQADGHEVMLINAGLASTCSQKIHNVLAGIAAALPVLQQYERLGLDSHQPNLQHPANADPAAANTINTSAEADGAVICAATCAWQGEQQHCVDSKAHSCSTTDTGSRGTATNGYVCVLDDDVALHPLSLMQLVDEMQAQPDLYMVTGFPYDLVTTTATGSQSGSSSSSNASLFGRLLAYAAATYHLPLLIGFSLADRGNFVWGGMVMLRANYLQPENLHSATAAGIDPATAAAACGKQDSNECAATCREAAGLPQSSCGAADTANPAATQRFVHGTPQTGAGQLDQTPNILKVWRDGGYSDDLLLTGYCAANALTIGLPSCAIFPQLLPPSYTFSQYWNYMRRQLFVLDTYYNYHSKVLNQVLMVAHSYGSLVFAAAAISTVVQIVALLLLLVMLCLNGNLLAAAGTVQCTALLGSSRAQSNSSTDTSSAGLIFSSLVGGCCDISAVVDQPTTSAAAAPSAGSMLPSVVRSIALHPAAAHSTRPATLADQESRCTSSSLSLLLNHGTSRATWGFIIAVLLSQAAMGFMLRQVLTLFRVLSPAASTQVLQPHISWALVWAGWVVCNTIIPFCMLYTYICDHITWGGIVYYKKLGKVSRVVHPAPSVAGAQHC